MKKSIMLLMAIFLTGAAYADDLQCFRYNPKHFTASKQWVPSGEKSSPEYLIEPIEDVYVLKLPELKRGDFYNYIGVVVKAAGKLYRNYYLDCSLEKGKYYCRGECDSGQVWLDRTNRLRFEFVNYSKDTMDGPVMLLDLRPKDSKQWIKGKKVVCPEEIKEGNYVCYGKKEKGQYFYCERSRRACEISGKQHFGHYNNETSVRAALMRCLKSTPKKD
jgi:hypothetical protein